MPIAGVATDKMLALRGDSALTIRHDHLHRITDDDLIAFALARSKADRESNAQAKIIAAEIVRDAPVGANGAGDGSLGEENAAQKEG